MDTKIANMIEGAIKYDLSQLMGNPVYEDLWVVPNSEGGFTLFVTYPIGFITMEGSADVPSAQEVQTRTENLDFKYDPNWDFMDGVIDWIDENLKEADEENDLDDVDEEYDED